MPARGIAIVGKADHNKVPTPAGGVDNMVTFIPWRFIKRGVRRQIITPLSAPDQFVAEAVESKPASDSALIRALGLAYYWQQLLDKGKVSSVAELAMREGVSRQRVSLILGLTLLAPSIVQDLMYGTTPTRLSLHYFKRNPMPLDWDVQKELMLIQRDA